MTRVSSPFRVYDSYRTLDRGTSSERSESSSEVLRRLFFQINQQVKWLVPAPAVRLKVPVESENVSRVQLIRQMDETGIGKIHGQVAILSHDTPHRCCGLG